MAAAVSRMRSKQSNTCAIAVDVALHDVPVVGAGVARRAGVAEDDAPLRARADRRRAATRREPVRAELERGDAAVHRRPVVLQARRHPDRLRLDVHRRRRAAPRGRRCDPVQRASAPHTATFSADEPAMPAPAGDSPRVRIVTPLAPNAAARRAEQRQRRRRRASAAAERPRRAARCLRRRSRRRSSARASSCDVRAQADGGIERLRAGMEQIERPDVDGAAGQIDPRRRRSRDAHGHIIILSSRFTRVAMPLATARDIGQLLIGSFPGTTVPAGVALAGARVRSRRRDPLQPQRRSARAGRRAGRARSRRSAVRCRPG